MGKSDINNLVIIGTLTREPEIKYTPSGTAVATVSIANNQTFVANNETKTSVNYFTVSAWGQTAVNVQKYLHKGSHIAVQGQLKQERWTDKTTGKTASRIVISANQISFLGSPQSQSKPQQPQAAPQTPAQTPPPQQNPWEEEGHYGVLSAPSDNFSYDEDIPF